MHFCIARLFFYVCALLFAPAASFLHAVADAYPCLHITVVVFHAHFAGQWLYEGCATNQGFSCGIGQSSSVLKHFVLVIFSCAIVHCGFSILLFTVIAALDFALSPLLCPFCVTQLSADNGDEEKCFSDTSVCDCFCISCVNVIRGRSVLTCFALVAFAI